MVRATVGALADELGERIHLLDGDVVEVDGLLNVDTRVVVMSCK